jgi:UPF0271 protein
MSQALQVDLNADVGEALGAQRSGDDERLFRYVTSANVACGFHAGDPKIIAATIEAAVARNVAVGAHPSYPDARGFGRQSMDIPAEELASVIVYQVGAVAALARAAGVKLVHVKPHGALYNDAAKNAALAGIVASAIAGYDNDLILVGLAGSHLISAGKAAGLRVAAEAFCDRTYEPDGSLRSRALPGALIEDPKQAASQALEIVIKRNLIAKGRVIPMLAQTLCVHGDTPNAPAIASAVRSALLDAGIEVTSLQQIV